MTADQEPVGLATTTTKKIQNGPTTAAATDETGRAERVATARGSADTARVDTAPAEATLATDLSISVSSFFYYLRCIKEVQKKKNRPQNNQIASRPVPSEPAAAKGRAQGNIATNMF